MTTAISSAQSVPYVPLSPVNGPDAVAADAAAPSQQQTAPALAGRGVLIADSTLGALVAQQNVSAGGAEDPTKTPAALDLKGQDLRATDLKSLVLKGADLSGANLSGVDLTGLDLSGAKLTGADLSGANLTNTNLTNISAQGADFSKAMLDHTTLDGADFSKAKFNGSFVGRAIDIAIPGGGQVTDHAANVKLDGANFDGASLRRILFENSSAAGTNFSNVTATSSAFVSSDLAGASFDHVSGRSLVFTNSDMSGAAFTNSTATFVGFYSTTIAGTKFAGGSFNGTNLSYTNLSAGDLTGMVREARGAGIQHTNLDGVDLSNFDFSNAIFDGNPAMNTGRAAYVVDGAKTSFTGTNFSGANFTNVIFQGTDVSQAKSFAGAQLQNTQYQSGNPGALANVHGVRVGLVRGQAIWIDIGDGPGPPGVPTARTVEEGRPMSQREAALQAAVSGTVPASDKDQAAALALKTLTAISDQLSAAKAAGGNDDAAATDSASVALSMLTKAADPREAAAADK